MRPVKHTLGYPLLMVEGISNMIKGDLRTILINQECSVSELNTLLDRNRNIKTKLGWYIEMDDDTWAYYEKPINKKVTYATNK